MNRTLYIIQMNFSLKHHQSLVSHCSGLGLSLGQCVWDLWRINGNLDRKFIQHFSFPVSLLFHECPILVFILKLLLTEGQTGEAWVVFNKSDAVLEIRCIKKKKYLHYFSSFHRVK